MSTRISVIIPAYNCAEFLPACLSSVIAQSEKSLEIFVVDDASTDETLNIITDFAQRDARIHALLLSEHQGVNSARNAALELAQGQYVMFCDGDDTVPPDAYRLLAEKADSGNYDVVIGSHENCNDDGNRIRVMVHPEDSLAGFMQTCSIWERIYSRDFLGRHSLRFRHYLVGGDVVFNGLVYHKNPKATFIKNSVYQYWTHNHGRVASIVNTHDLAHFQERLRCYKDFVELFAGTKDQKDAITFVCPGSVSYIHSKFLHILDGRDAEPAFEQLRKFLNDFDWSHIPDYFELEFGVSLQQMFHMTALEYRLSQKGSSYALDPRDEVLLEFRQGKIGLRYILEYFKAWTFCKLGKGGRSL